MTHPDGEYEHLLAAQEAQPEPLTDEQYNPYGVLGGIEGVIDRAEDYARAKPRAVKVAVVAGAALVLKAIKHK